jgi:hypothetical protein
MATVLDHLGLLHATKARSLIEQASNSAPIVYLEPLDKGLSGASVWQARWRTPKAHKMSRLHVFKIGEAKKLQREYDAIVNYAYAIDNYTPRASLFHLHDAAAPMLLRSEFVSDSAVVSLRDHIRNLEHVASSVDCINDLFETRMRAWHYDQESIVEDEQTLGDALDWWVNRRAVERCANFLGRSGVEALVQSCGSSSVTDLAEAIESLANQRLPIRFGIVHGDLHTQNVLLDTQRNMHLIDFGWTAERWRAIDFLMLESSLKFLVAPRSARMTDLLQMERFVAEHPFGEPPDQQAIEKWASALLFGDLIGRVTGAVLATRHQALACQAVDNERSYLSGLALLGAGLTSMPPKINLALVIASTAIQLSRLGL